MSSKKPSAKAKRVAAFKAQLAGSRTDDAFARERAHRSQREAKREQAREERACTSKKWYRTQGEAAEAIRACADHGTTGLNCYKCSYCDGWHLTSRKHEI